MGMSIGGSTSAGVGQSAAVGNWQQRQQNFSNLTSALQSGNLSAAQQAFSSLSGNSSNVSSNSPLAQLGQALQSGNLTAAQQAMQTLMSQRGGHHHHHGGQNSQANAASTTATPPVTNSYGTGSLVNTVA